MVGKILGAPQRSDYPSLARMLLNLADWGEDSKTLLYCLPASLGGRVEEGKVQGANVLCPPVRPSSPQPPFTEQRRNV